MTIHNRVMHEKLSNLENADSEINDIFDAVYKTIRDQLKLKKMKCDNGDSYRDLETYLYGKIREWNPDKCEYLDSIEERGKEL